MNAIAIIVLTLKISLFLTALGYGLKTTSSDAFYLFRKPGLLLRSILAMNIIMPVIALLIALNFNLPPLVKVALVAISVSPLAPLFPGKPLKAGGHEAYVIGLMIIASLLSLILIPLTLKILGNSLEKPIGISMKVIVITALVSVIVPLILGIAMRYFAPAFTGKIANPVARIAQILLIVSVLPILFKMFPAIIHLVGNGTVLAIAAFSILGMLVGHFLGGPEPTDRSVLALASASRHPAIAITVASANLADHKLVPAAILLYLLINALVGLPYQKWMHKGKSELPQTPTG
jgi:BASS family bile acid:Na+ symporter